MTSSACDSYCAVNYLTSLCGHFRSDFKQGHVGGVGVRKRYGTYQPVKIKEESVAGFLAAKLDDFYAGASGL